MPRPIHRLSAKECKHPSKPKLADGGGLYLLTTPARSSRWEFHYTRDGRSRYMGMGGYPAVSLPKARSEAEKCRNHLTAGRDPLVEKRKPRKRTTATFTTTAAEFIRAKRHGWSNRKHAHQWISTLSNSHVRLSVIWKLARSKWTTFCACSSRSG